MTRRCGGGGGMEWPRIELGKAAEIRGGATPCRNNPAYWGGKIPWLTPTDLPANGSGVTEVTSTVNYITEEGLASCSACLLPRDTVLFSSRASIGKVGIAAVPLSTNQGFANFIPRRGVDSRYLAWCLHFHAEQIEGLAGSTTFKEVSKSALRRFPIPLPPVSEQRRIVEILDQADRLRRLRAEADAKADRILPALFIRMFGDPATNPMGWPVGDLGDAMLETQYGTSKRANTRGDGVLVVRMNNISRSGDVDLTDVKYVELDDSELERQRLEPGDLLFNRTNSADLVGKTGRWTESSVPAVAASYLIRVRVDPAKALPEYVWALMNSSFIKMLLANKARRAVGMANINATELRGLPALFPPLPLQQGFAERLRELEPCVERRRRAAAALDRLLANLMSWAFSGALTASWREAHMRELLQEMEQQAKALATE
ncbi:MAG: restriction endonuclease subunit S [Planctomycetes bacterium]|nr:restriction endonuclease subunit S [Planctomycetota bacterium]